LEPNTTNHKTPDCKAQEARVVMPTLIWLTTNSLLCQSVGYTLNLNFAVFGEYFQNFLQLFYHPGFRFEKYAKQKDLTAKNLDLAGNVILDENQQENNVKDRNFIIGVGLSYKPQNQIELYGNVSQNYRSVTFNDIRTVSPSNVIDPNISDEKDLLQTLVYVDNWETK
jgi:outer membrane receptor protein involved in Fe transport